MISILLKSIHTTPKGKNDGARDGGRRDVRRARHERRRERESRGSGAGRPRGALSGAALAEETRRVEATLSKLQETAARVRSFSEVLNLL